MAKQQYCACGAEAFPYSEDDETLVCSSSQDYVDQCEDRPRPFNNGQEYKLCPQCRGTGKMVHPALSVWTASDRYEDPDGFEGMMRGDYDITCDRCLGLRVVTVVSERKYHQNREDHFTMLMEQGIYPGNPDYF